jgi:hypothetical protein
MFLGQAAMAYGAFLLGAATAVYMIPDKQIGIVVLTNGAPVGLAEAVALNFLDSFEYETPKMDYLSILKGDYAALRQGVLDVSTNYSIKKPPSSPTPGGSPAGFAGTYSNPYFGKIEVDEQQGKLILRLPPLGAYYELSHWDGDTYTYYIPNEMNGAARRGVDFSADGGQITVQNLNLEYSNVFKRVR